MIETKRDLTVHIKLDAKKTLPFPELDDFADQLVPFYTLSELIQIDKTIYSNDFHFIQSNISNKKGITIAFAVLFGIFLVLSIVMTIIYFKKFKTPHYLKTKSILESEGDIDDMDEFDKLAGNWIDLQDLTKRD